MKFLRKSKALLFALVFVFSVSGFGVSYLDGSAVFAAENAEAASTSVKPSRPKMSLNSKGDIIILNVKKTTNADGYLIYLKGEQDKKFSLVRKVELDGSAKRRILLTALEDGKYSVRVKAYNGKTKSKYSKVKSVTVDNSEIYTIKSEDGVKLSNDSSDFVLLTDAVPDAILEIRYYSTYNFIGDRIDGYEEPLAFLTKEAAAALKEVSDELVEKGYRLKIFDAYRPQRAVTNFMNWALDADDARMKDYFYPELEKDVLFPLGYIAAHSGHSRGSTVDLTLFDMRTEKEVDMGGTFDYFGELSHPDYTDITDEQYANRMLLREVMLKHGFNPLEEEWWHFTLKDEPYKDTYFTFPVNSDSVAKSDEDLSGILSSWNDTALAKEKMVSYMESITDKSSADYIPVESRIAVFDLDGTLYCETDPNYFDHLLLMHRVLEDPDYKDKASDFEKKVANDVISMNETGVEPENMPINHGKAVASSFAGFTPDEFYDYIAEYKKTPMNSYEGMTLGEAFYQPMIEIVDYLQANDFTVYIVSGTDRFIVRGLVKDSKLNIPNKQIIGSDETLVSNNQGDTDGLNYVFDENDKVVFGGDFIVKNLKMNKVTVIMQEIGVQPVLSFGNSTGDASMAEFVTSNNPYKSLAFMLCCDDTERENGNTAKAEKMFSLCEKYDWVPVSMKNDWKTIYGENVKKKTDDEMDYWKTELANDKLILSAKEIEKLNVKNFSNGCGLVDISAYESIDSAQIVEMIEDYSFPSKEYTDGRKITAKEIESIKENRNLSEASKSAKADIKYAVTTENASIRAFPTDTFLTNESGRYDYLQETGIDYGSPILVLWDSKDGEWSFVQTSYYNGWMKKSSFGYCDKAVFETIRTALKNGEVLCVRKTGSVSLGTDKNSPSVFLRMGTYLPYKDGKLTYFVRMPNGSAVATEISLPLNALNGIAGEILELTSKNLLDIAENALGTPYSWGDLSEEGMDCSSTLQGIFNCFGIFLPRNSSQQVKLSADITELKDLSLEEKIEKIKNLPLGTILYMPGHVMLYLGEKDGVPYIIHNTNDSENDDGTFTVYNSCVLTSALIGKTGNTLLDRITYAVNLF